MRESRNFFVSGGWGGGGGGGVQVNLTKKKALTTFFLVLSLFYRSQMVNFKETFLFQGSVGVQHFPGGGGVPLFPEGSNCLFPINPYNL